MAYDQDNAEKELSGILNRVQAVTSSLERDIINYRRSDTLTSEADQMQTMRDIRFYLLRAYKEMDSILNVLDRYK